MTPEEQREADCQMELIDSAFRTLSEHFDTVAIFCTRHIADDTGTVKWHRGGGNWYARYGHIKSWVLYEEAGLSERPKDE
jgi:hypothetical protein